LALEDLDALSKHMDCKMKRRGSCCGGRDREKVCVTLVIATIPSKRGRPPKDPLVFVNTNMTSTSKTPLRHSTRLKTRCFNCLYTLELFFNNYATQLFLHLILFNLVFTQIFGHFNFL
jgi:hypothetical protein